jgi:predicted RNase H-like HicB family nuclease
VSNLIANRMDAGFADIPELPGVLAYGATPDEAEQKAEAIAHSLLANRS